eukprot:44628-Eustigmatos_ZCMA.PRE.1
MKNKSTRVQKTDSSGSQRRTRKKNGRAQFSLPHLLQSTLLDLPGEATDTAHIDVQQTVEKLGAKRTGHACQAIKRQPHSQTF